MSTMKTNDLKKGDHVCLMNGWAAEIMDNKKGNARLALVHGTCSEMGSVYAHDIRTGRKRDEPGQWHDIEHTPDQIRCRDMNKRLFG
jgi:hypothetical protein